MAAAAAFSEDLALQVLSEIRRRSRTCRWAELRYMIDPCWLVHRALAGGGIGAAVRAMADSLEAEVAVAKLEAEASDDIGSMLRGYLASLDEMGDDDQLAGRLRSLLDVTLPLAKRRPLRGPSPLIAADGSGRPMAFVEARVPFVRPLRSGARVSVSAERPY
jgi:hypothetical protein